MTPRAHLMACRGLTLAETGWLAAALRHPDPKSLTRHLDKTASQRLSTALDRCKDTPPEALSAKILGRCQEARALGLSRVHPSWLEDMAQHERPQALDAAMGKTTGEGTLANNTAAWLTAALSARFGALDPRHAWELRQGQVLELDQLRLIRGRDLNLLVLHTGLAMLGEGLREASARAVATVAKRLGGALGQALVDAVKTPLGWGPEALALCKHGLKMTSGGRQSPDRRAVKLGLYALACAAGPRRADTAHGLAATMNMTKGQWLMTCWHSLPSGPAVPTLSDTIATQVLETLPRLSKAGHTREDYQGRVALIAPPTKAHP